MVPTGNLPGSFQRDNVQWLLDDANPLSYARIGAYLAGIVLGDVEANRAHADSVAHFLDRRGQGHGFVTRCTDQVKGEPGGRFRSDAGQFAEFVDQPRDRCRGSATSRWLLQEDSLA